MASTKKVVTNQEPQHRQRPAISVESREKQMIALAVDLAEKQLRDGSASSQIITHYLKLGTTLASLEKEKLENENLLLKAKADNIKSASTSEELYQKALNAMMLYSGKGDLEDEDL